MRALLFKRLESSIEAFRSTLDSLLRSNRNFRQALEDGYVPIGNTRDATACRPVLRCRRGSRQYSNRKKIAGSRKDVQAVQAGSIRPMTSRPQAWLVDLDADYAVLREIRERIKDITPEDDDKLQTLRQFLDRPEVASGKVLIFSEAETTVEYLFNQLNPSGRKTRRSPGSPAAPATARSHIIRRFAPKANAVQATAGGRGTRFACYWRQTSCPRARTYRTAPAC